MQQLTLAQAYKGGHITPKQLLAYRLASYFNHHLLDCGEFGPYETRHAVLRLLKGEAPSSEEPTSNERASYNYIRTSHHTINHCYCIGCETYHVDSPCFTYYTTTSVCSACNTVGRYVSTGTFRMYSPLQVSTDLLDWLATT